jgi:hypothetical protein
MGFEGLELRSLIKKGGELELSLVKVKIPSPPQMRSSSELKEHRSILPIWASSSEQPTCRRQSHPAPATVSW